MRIIDEEYAKEMKDFNIKLEDFTHIKAIFEKVK